MTKLHIAMFKDNSGKIFKKFIWRKGRKKVMVHGDGVRTATVGHDVFTSPLLTSILVKMSGQRPSRPRERLYKFCGFISNVLSLVLFVSWFYF